MCSGMLSSRSDQAALGAVPILLAIYCHLWLFSYLGSRLWPVFANVAPMGATMWLFADGCHIATSGVFQDKVRQYY